MTWHFAGRVIYRRHQFDVTCRGDINYRRITEGRYRQPAAGCQRREVIILRLIRGCYFAKSQVDTVQRLPVRPWKCQMSNAILSSKIRSGRCLATTAINDRMAKRSVV